MRPTRDTWAMGLAQLTAQRATCLRRQVGCVLLSERGHVLSTGYNGVAAGRPHCNEATGSKVNPELFVHPTTGKPLLFAPRRPEHWELDMVPVYAHACPGAQSPSGTNLDGCEAVHAEQNALLQCRDIYQIHTAYVTTSPCMTCTKLLLNTGCQRILFLEAYPHTKARDLWLEAGRDWMLMPNKT